MIREVRYKGIFETLRKEILSGKYLSSARFPSDNSLAKRFKVGRQTVYQAVSKLQDCGLVRRERGSGTYLTRSARGRAGAIAVVAPSFPKTEIVPVICRELSRICQENDRLLWFLDEYSTSPGEALENLRKTAEKLVEQKVAGVIFRPVDYYENSEEINRTVTSVLKRSGIPLVLIDSEMVTPPDDSGFDIVGVDNMMTGWLLGRHVVEKGAKRILYVYRARSSSNVNLRLIGIKAAVSVKNPKVRVEEACMSDLSATTWTRVVRKFRPDAILCSGDVVAGQVVKILSRMRLRIPKDVMVAGVDDVEISRVITPALTTIRQPCEEIARVAFELLGWRMSNPDAMVRRIALPARLIVRDSA